MIRENAFEHKIKKARVSFNAGLSVNRPSNNSALIFNYQYVNSPLLPQYISCGGWEKL